MHCAHVALVSTIEAFQMELGKYFWYMGGTIYLIFNFSTPKSKGQPIPIRLLSHGGGVDGM